MAVRFEVVFLLLVTIVLIDLHLFEQAGRNMIKKCYAMAWTGMAIFVMASLIYAIYK